MPCFERHSEISPVTETEAWLTVGWGPGALETFLVAPKKVQNRPKDSKNKVNENKRTPSKPGDVICFSLEKKQMRGG